MIGKFWSVLFKYADQTKKMYGVTSEQYKTVQEIEDLLQQVYDEGIQYEIDMDMRPTCKEEAIAFTITGLERHTDGEHLFYELDGRHFDTPKEVLEYVIKDREREYRYMRRQYERAVKKWTRDVGDALLEILKPRLDAVSVIEGVQE